MKILGYCLSFFFLFVTRVNVVWAQERFAFHNTIVYITMDNGLLHNYIDDIYKDKQGFLWISTSGGGLSRYDGYEFTHYNTNTVRIKLKSNFIRNVCEDDFGRLWIASEGGIDVLNPAMMQQVVLRDSTGLFAGLVNQPAVAVMKDANGCIWFYCGNSLYKIRFTSKGDVAEIYTLPSVPLTIPAIALKDVDKDGNIWIGLGNSVCKLYQGDNRMLKPILVAPSLKFEEGIFISVFKAKEEDVWIGTDRGLIRYNRNKEMTKRYAYEKGNEHSLSQSHVTDLAITNDKQLIVSTLKGINIYNPITDGFESVTQENTPAQSSLNSNFVNCLLVDEDIIWIGTETGGINKVIPRKLSVHNFIHAKNDPYSLSKNPVNAIYEDKNGYLWVGTVEGGFNRKTPDSNQFMHYTAESTSKLSHNSVSVITADKADRLWIGTWGNGISLFDLEHPERPAIKYISTQTYPDFSVDFIGALCYDSINNGMWIGCNPGIFFYDLSADKLITPFPNTTAGNMHGVVGSLIDRRGRLWMGCMEGVYIIDLYSRSGNLFSYKYLNYKLDNPDSHLIEKITCFCQSKDSVLWLGSNGYGLYKYLPGKDGSDSFVSFTTKQGLINNDVKGILEDEYGHLWISTNNGLSCFDPVSNRFTNYTKEDGLAGNHFYWNAYCRSRSGLLYFGELNGLVAINASRLTPKDRMEKVVLTRLWVANEEILPGDKYIDADISVAKTLHLHESDKSFSLEFSALNVEPRASAFYSYRLNGFDDQWMDVPATRRFAGYTNLPPGEYSFQVKYIPAGTTEEGNIPITELTIIVHPFFYKTTWFILLVIFLSGCIVIYLYKKRIRTLKNQQNEKITQQKQQIIEMSEKVQELTIDRLAFFTNITHEFRTPITLIIGPIERALKLSKNPQVIEQLHFVERNSKYLLSLVNQLMDFRKIESGKLEIVRTKGNLLNFVDSLILPFEVFAENRNIRIQKFYRLNAPDFLFDPDAMQKVLTNLLSNAVKFTPNGGTISLYVTSFTNKDAQKETLFLSIKDTGTGIAAEDMNKIFDRFYQSRNHVKFPIYGQSGTGIGLYLCKRIIELQEGSIQVKNNRKTGCTFCVSLPLLREEGIIPDDCDKALSPQPEQEEECVSTYFSPGKLTILVVEDNKDMCGYMHSILSEQYNILEAGNGAEALSVLSVHNVDFIISDWMMPVMDGLELSRKVKENFTISHIPFLMLTAKTAQESRIESYQAGVDEYLMKPFNEELLLTRISNILENRKRYQQQFAESMKIEALQMGEESRDEKFMRKVLKVIRENYKNPYYESSDFVEAVGVSKSLLNKKMQSIVGQSIGQFIRNYRLNIAHELISKNRITKNMNISEIAYEVGFNDPKYFTRCFTKRFHIPPSSLLAEI